MSQSTFKELKKMSPVFKYLVLSFYCLLIGFCGVGIWLKWDDVRYQRSLTNYDSHVFEEGFDEVTVSIPMVRSERNESFLSRLARRTTPPPVLVAPRDRNVDVDQTWQRHAAAPVVVPEGNAKVILVIDDLGILKRTTKRMIDMDAPLTLAFLPYAPGVAEQAQDAYEKGHDILVHIPMEPKGNADPGPHALLSSASSRVQQDSIHFNLSQFPNYIGINNHMGSRFTEDEVSVDRLLTEIKERGLIVLDSKTSPNSVLEDIARVKGIPVANRDVFLDNIREESYIAAQLQELERIAKSSGTALAIGHPYPQTVRALEKWIPTLSAKGITIVPISQSIVD